ncbi:MAG: hypothetical protein B7X60_00650 [Polynucleobacter sp. 39-45-136]|jgi:hypothetical protein|nr:MAG: hypothetical protein B7X60_00650 [Polynucleobacter sp. 39-45-136]
MGWTFMGRYGCFELLRKQKTIFRQRQLYQAIIVYIRNLASLRARKPIHQGFKGSIPLASKPPLKLSALAQKPSLDFHH